MDEYRFFKNTLSTLELIKKRKHGLLVDEGWISQKELDQILTVVHNLDYVISDQENEWAISEKGLRALESLISENMPDLLNIIINALPTDQTFYL